MVQGPWTKTTVLEWLRKENLCAQLVEATVADLESPEPGVMGVKGSVLGGTTQCDTDRQWQAAELG